MEQLFEDMQRQLGLLQSDFRRYMYPAINWSNRMLCLVGPRGIGKTTLFLQRIKELGAGSQALYITADHMYFASHTLYETAGSFNRLGGVYLFIDEVHKYPDWSRELKIIYDAYPDMHVYFTGSSVLDIERGEADLSRRAPRYLMQGLSFREYLAIFHNIEMEPLPFEKILANGARVPGITHPLPLFKDYLRHGYYPFGLDADFNRELDQVIGRTLEVDIPQFADMNTSTGRKLKRLMAVVSTLVPFKPNMSKLASQVGVSRNGVEDYLGYMEKAGMIAQLRTSAGGIGALGKAEKVYLDNTNILYNLAGGDEDVGTVRETFFFNQVRAKHEVLSSPVSDFLVEGRTFEIGGRGKGRKQIEGVQDGYIVKDDIETGFGNVIPLWAFGLEY